jgi:hypothetical protein
MFVVIQDVWNQVSPDFDTAHRRRTRVVTAETTIGEIMEWADSANVIGKGDVVLTRPDQPIIGTES